MNNQIQLFEGNDVKVKTDEGNTLINLVHVAKCCGLTRQNNGGNGLKVRWDDIKKKVDLIGVGASTPEKIKGEVTYILDEIENTDDRNSIYMSSWLSKRLAIECHSEKANRFKDWLVTLDEARENGKLMPALLEKSACVEDLIIMQAESMKALREDVQAVKQASLDNQQAIQGIRDVVAINTSTVSWRGDCRKIIVRIAHKLGGNSFIGDVNREIYELMRIRLKTKLDVKLTNLRRRMAEEGVCKSKRDKMNYLDVIKDDARLVEGYVSIVKELAVKYGADIKEAM